MTKGLCFRVHSFANFFSSHAALCLFAQPTEHIAPPHSIWFSDIRAGTNIEGRPANLGLAIINCKVIVRAWIVHSSLPKSAASPKVCSNLCRLPEIGLSGRQSMALPGSERVNGSSGRTELHLRKVAPYCAQPHFAHHKRTWKSESAAKPAEPHLWI